MGTVEMVGSPCQLRADHPRWARSHCNWALMRALSLSNPPPTHLQQPQELVRLRAHFNPLRDVRRRDGAPADDDFERLMA